MYNNYYQKKKIRSYILVRLPNGSLMHAKYNTNKISKGTPYKTNEQINSNKKKISMSSNIVGRHTGKQKYSNTIFFSLGRHCINKTTDRQKRRALRNNIRWFEINLLSVAMINQPSAVQSRCYDDRFSVPVLERRLTWLSLLCMCQMNNILSHPHMNGPPFGMYITRVLTLRL